MDGRKLHDLLQPFMIEHGIKMGRDALFDLMAANRLLVRKENAEYKLLIPITGFANIQTLSESLFRRVLISYG